MKRLVIACMAIWMAAFSFLPAAVRADWAEGLFLRGQEELQDSLIAPKIGLEYPLQVLVDGNPADLTDAVLGEEKLSLEVEQGKALLARAAIEKREGVHTLVLQTASGITLPGEVKLTLRRSLAGKEQASCTVSFRVGWETADSSRLESLKAGEPIPVEQQSPAFTKAQLLGLMEKNAGDPLTFVGEGWSLEVLPAAAKDVCFLYNNDKIEAVSNRLEEKGRLLEFVNFPAGVTLGNKGTLTLDVSDLEEFNGNFYVYRYAYGKLYRYPASYDRKGSLTIPTAVLDHYVITNMPVAEGTVVAGSQTDHTEKNPDTGDFTAVAGMTVMAIAAGAVALGAAKKK